MKHYDFIYSGGCWLLGQRNANPVEVYVGHNEEEALKKAEAYVADKAGTLHIHSIRGQLVSTKTYLAQQEPTLGPW